MTRDTEHIQFIDNEGFTLLQEPTQMNNLFRCLPFTNLAKHLSRVFNKRNPHRN